jgi:hypothetical protein
MKVPRKAIKRLTRRRSRPNVVSVPSPCRRTTKTNGLRSTTRIWTWRPWKVLEMKRGIKIKFVRHRFCGILKILQLDTYYGVVVDHSEVDLIDEDASIAYEDLKASQQEVDRLAMILAQGSPQHFPDSIAAEVSTEADFKTLPLASDDADAADLEDDDIACSTQPDDVEGTAVEAVGKDDLSDWGDTDLAALEEAWQAYD